MPLGTNAKQLSLCTACPSANCTFFVYTFLWYGSFHCHYSITVNYVNCAYAVEASMSRHKHSDKYNANAASE